MGHSWNKQKKWKSEISYVGPNMIMSASSFSFSYSLSILLLNVLAMNSLCNPSLSIYESHHDAMKKMMQKNKCRLDIGVWNTMLPVLFILSATWSKCCDYVIVVKING